MRVSLLKITTRFGQRNYGKNGRGRTIKGQDEKMSNEVPIIG